MRAMGLAGCRRTAWRVCSAQPYLSLSLDAPSLVPPCPVCAVDQLYKVSSQDKLRRDNVFDTLGTLGYMGGQVDGLFGVLACGSAAVTPRLVAADSALRSRYALLEHADVPDLNCTKFRKLPIESSDCTDIAQVQQIIFNTPHSLEVREAERARLSSITAFVAGSVPRMIASVLSSRRHAAESDLAAGGLLSSHFAPSAKLSDDVKQLYALVCKQLLLHNTQLLEHCRASDGGFNADAVADGSWAKLVRPVPKAVIMEEWRAYGPGGVQLLLDDLSDAGLIAQRDTLEHDESIWPISAAQLFFLPGREGASIKPLVILIYKVLADVLALAANAVTVAGAAT